MIKLLIATAALLGGGFGLLWLAYSPAIGGNPAATTPPPIHNSPSSTVRPAALHSFQIDKGLGATKLAANFSIDTQHVYSYGRVVSGARPDSFQSLNTNYHKDALSTYYGREDITIMTDSDTTTFDVFDDTFEPLARSLSDFAWTQNYARDKKAVYYSGTAIPLSDSSTFRLLGNFYSTDANRVYFLGDSVRLADPITFELVGQGHIDAKDANHLFYRGQPVSD